MKTDRLPVAHQVTHSWAEILDGRQKRCPTDKQTHKYRQANTHAHGRKCMKHTHEQTQTGARTNKHKHIDGTAHIPVPLYEPVANLCNLLSER